jgi:ABC-2 type transport system ATP-binding protein
MIEVSHLTKRYGDKTAVDDLTFTVLPGIVTGFLGPNGAGKSTTMRMALGLDAPTSGEVTVAGKHYRDSVAPLHEVGALLEAKAIHPGRSAYSHLLAIGATHGIGRRRVNEVLELVGLDDVARRRAGQFSLGMGQRLGIATALLGDPRVVMLDEPVNGLDPEGVLWVRHLLRDLAAEGRTVLVQPVDRLVVIGRGRLLADTTVQELITAAADDAVIVRSPQTSRLRELLVGPDVSVTGSADELTVTGLTAEQVGERAAAAGVVLHQLSSQTASLEEAFMKMTGDSVEFHGRATPHVDEPTAAGTASHRKAS